MKETEKDICIWTEQQDGEFYSTSCGKAFCMIDGTPKENDMNFCCYCGERLIEGPFMTKEIYEGMGFGR